LSKISGERDEVKKRLDDAEGRSVAQRQSFSYLHQRIVDLEKVIAEYDTETRRIRTKNATLMT